MTIYAFCCGVHGGFEVVAPMGQAGRHRACPDCGEPGTRVYAAPMIARTDRRVGAAVERAERSASEPDVVRSVPGSGSAARSRSTSTNPAWQRLPRP